MRVGWGGCCPADRVTELLLKGNFKVKKQTQPCGAKSSPPCQAGPCPTPRNSARAHARSRRGPCPCPSSMWLGRGKMVPPLPLPLGCLQQAGPSQHSLGHGESWALPSTTPGPAFPLPQGCCHLLLLEGRWGPACAPPRGCLFSKVCAENMAWLCGIPVTPRQLWGQREETGGGNDTWNW